MLADYYREIEKGNQQVRPEWAKLLSGFHRHVKPKLVELFHGKCAYCESQIYAMSPGDVEQFRPKQAATNLSGEASIGHYGWLAMEWTNLLYACSTCNWKKGARFPVRDVRAPILTPIDSIDDYEQPLLLDPCKDDPAAHLLFEDNGSVSPLTTRGDVTIETLALNRLELVHQRERAIRVASTFLQGLLSLPDNAPVDLRGNLIDLMAPDKAYSAAIRAHISRHAGELVSADLLSPAERTATTRPRQSGSAEGDAARQLQTRRLKRIEIRNFKLLRNFVLELPEPGEQAPWLVLLGENAAGKSAVLLATALALAGAKTSSRHLKPDDVLRRGARSGHVNLTFWDDTTANLSFKSGGRAFGGTQATSERVLAYGSNRISGQAGTRGAPVAQVAHISAITGPIADLPNPQPWLRRLRMRHVDPPAGSTQPIKPPNFDDAARVLKSVLFREDSFLTRRKGKIIFTQDGDEASLDELSAGYRAIVAMAVDILTVLLDRWSAPEAAEGFVIIDELESHLHPRWKMRIVDAFRRSFERVQFLISTHDPLILRGVKNGEVQVMRRDPENGAVADRRVPNIEGLRVDQLLMSEHFGLSSTIDPELEADYEQYYRLLAIPRPSPRQERELGRVRKRLEGKGQMGDNPRERLLYGAIDAHLAERRRNPVLSGDDDLSAELQQLWDEA